MSGKFGRHELKDAENWFLGIMSLGEEGMDSRMDVITPARAKVILENNPDNRNIRDAKVEQYVQDMRHGRWRANGESIIIAASGELNDGQHRLTAIVKSGIKQLMNVVYGAKREDRNTIDLGAAKSAGDHMSMNGMTNANIVAAATRAVLAFELGGTINNTSRISGPAIIQRATEDDLMREVGNWAGNNAHKFRPLYIRGGLTGAAYYLLAKKAPLEAHRFMETLRDGTYLTPESTIFILRQRLALSPRLAPSQKLEAIIRGWNAWIRDEKLTRIQIMGNIPAIKGPKRVSNES